MLVLHVHIVYPLVIALIILAAAAVTAVASRPGTPESPARLLRRRVLMRLAALSSEEMTPEQVDLYRKILSGPRGQGPRTVLLATGAGALSGPFNAMLYAPEVGHALEELGLAIRFKTELTPRIRETAILVVAQAWDSTYEQAAHELIGHDAGLTEPEIEALRAGADPGFADEQERVAYHVARSLTGPARPGRQAVRRGGRHPGGAGPGRAVRPGRLLRDAGPADAHLPRQPGAGASAVNARVARIAVARIGWPGSDGPESAHWTAPGTWEWELVPGPSIPPLGFKITLSDQIRPV